MVVHCVIRKNNPDTPVELFIDTASAAIRMNTLFSEGEEVSLYTTEI